MELTVIILNWNAATETMRCISTVTSWECIRPTIWVVDNGSADGSDEVISRQYPDIHLVRNSTNLGFAGGNNRGIVQALTAGDAPILLLNNDALIEEQDVIRLADTLQSDARLGLVGPLLFDITDTIKLLSAGGRDISRYTNSHICAVVDGEPIREVDYVPGTVVMVRAEIFRTVGLFDEDYFFGGELADLCERARQHGYLSAVDAWARAFHALDRSSDLRERLHIYYVFRNRFLFIRKFRHTRMVPLYCFWTIYGMAVSLAAQLRGKQAKARAIRLGVLDGLRGRFGGQNERVLRDGTAPRTSLPKR